MSDLATPLERSTVETTMSIDAGVGAYTLLLTGHFHAIPGYGARRKRGTPDFLLIATLGGRGRFGYAGGELIAEEGDLVLLRPGTPHDYACVPGEPWELLWAHFQPRPHWYELLGWPQAAPGLVHLRPADPAARERILEQFREVHRLANGGLPRRALFAAAALETLLLWCDTQNPLTQPATMDPRVQETVQTIFERMKEKLTLEELADAVHLSPSRLSHLFREQVGVPPLQFLDRQRADRARLLLERSSAAIANIAAEFDFDPLYFSRWFKRHTGLSPRAYRQAHEAHREDQ